VPPLTDDDLATILRSMLQGQEGSSGDLASHWTAKITSANYAAQSDIAEALAARGFSIQQILEGDSYGKFNEDIALFWIGVKYGSHITNDDIKGKLAALDRRAELKTVPWMIDGTVVDPDGDESRQSASGAFAWPANGATRNPLETMPAVRRSGEIPYPGF
jgi:hypothetical protein